jgi:hypothetical protein
MIMKMNRTQRLLASVVMIVGLLALGQAAIAQGKGHGGEKGHGHGNAHHNNGQQMVGEKIHSNGHHVIDKKGHYTTAVEVQNGKIAGVHVKHDTKGDVPVTKYKTNQKMAAGGRIVHASLRLIQDQYLGTTYIGYAYVDDFGNEEIYWFPYDMILDGDTGAIDYVPAS